MAIENIEALLYDKVNDMPDEERIELEKTLVHNMVTDINTMATDDPDELPDQTPKYVDPDLEEGA